MVEPSMNAPSRFIKEIPVDLLEGMEPVKKSSSDGIEASGSTLQGKTSTLTARQHKHNEKQL